MYLVRANISHFIYKFIFNPFMYGLYGFFVFLVTDMLLKVFLLILDSREVFAIKEQDIALSLLGFFAFFLIKVVKNFNKKRKFH